MSKVKQVSYGDLSNTIKLRDGNEMPLFGLGVYSATEGSETVNAVIHALNNGYRLVDTAQAYNNERSVGEAIKKGNIPRNEVFVVTKLKNNGYNECKHSFMESLKSLVYKVYQSP